MNGNKNILVAPLDWGMGHTTRCIPIISYLQELGHTVFAAAEGESAVILKANFPSLEIINLEGYRISYSKTKGMFTLKILSQIPKIASRIKTEHHWLKQVIKEYNLDFVISDNRYGLYSADIPCVIMTHQVQILSGFGAIANAILLRIHRKLLEKFSKTWIVDEENNPGLAGTLSHPKRLPKNSEYIGWLSQFSIKEKINSDSTNNNHFLILLSGPEPMRTALEEKLWQSASALPDFTFSFIAGKPGLTKPGNIPAHISWKSHANADELLVEISKARGVICRSGYTSLMDLKILGKPAILIPTPGQTEQIYLAEIVSKNSDQFCTVDSNNWNLSNEIEKLLKINPNSSEIKDKETFKRVLEQLFTE